MQNIWPPASVGYSLNEARRSHSPLYSEIRLPNQMLSYFFVSTFKVNHPSVVIFNAFSNLVFSIRFNNVLKKLKLIMILFKIANKIQFKKVDFSFYYILNIMQIYFIILVHLNYSNKLLVYTTFLYKYYSKIQFVFTLSPLSITFESFDSIKSHSFVLSVQ